MVHRHSVFIAAIDLISSGVRGSTHFQESWIWIGIGSTEERAEHVVEHLRVQDVRLVIIWLHMLGLGIQVSPDQKQVTRVTSGIEIVVWSAYV